MLLMLPLFGAHSFAAPAAPVAVESIKVTPDAMMPGRHPDITANIKRHTSDRPKDPLQINIVAVLTRPDHVTKSWVWKKIVLSPGESKLISLPKEYDTRLVGGYRVEFVVYSGDMRRRLNALVRTFTVAEKHQPAMRSVTKPEKRDVSASDEGRYLRPERERSYLGVGVYANALNPAGGATMLVWPFKYLGLQATYTVGTFTSYEGRLLAKIGLSSGFSPYFGAGYLHVAKTTDVIGVNTTFTDSSVSGVAGIEVPLSRKLTCYLEVSGAAINLKKIVTNGSQTVEAAVEYAPITIGAGLVFSLF